MTLPVLIAGLVLELAGSDWFSGAGTVGLILTIVGGLGLLIQAVIMIVVAGAMRRF